MEYITPKTDWTVPDIVNTTDMNSIGENLRTARAGGGESVVPPISIAADLDIGLVKSVFIITGSITTIERIEYSDGVDSDNDRVSGNIITLIFDTDATIDCTATTTDYTHAGITHYLSSINIYQGDTLQFVAYGSGLSTIWYPIHVHNTGNN